MQHRPGVVSDYNQYMGVVDRSNQLVTCHNVLIKSMRCWTSLLFYMLDINYLDGYVVCQAWQNLHPGIPELQRGARESYM